MKKYFYWSLLLSALTFFSQPSFALSKLGHQVVCQLAFDHLSLAKQQRVRQQLNAVPRKQQAIINQYNQVESNTPITFANACTWADAIKNHREFKQYKPWHYLNVSRDLIHIKKPLCSRNCLPQAIITHQKQLQSSPRSWQSAQALLFLGHWVADIHQPLHISYASDLGGNKIQLIDSKSRCNNLHNYWDQCILQSAKRTKAIWIQQISRQWNTISVPSFYGPQVWRWADESYQLVRQPSFQYCQLTGQGECLKPQGKVTLSDDYAMQHIPIMQKQLLRAAKRLTKILDKSL